MILPEQIRELDSDMAALRMVVELNMTVYHALELKHSLLDALLSASALEVDLSQVREIDTSGIQLLMLAKRESLSQGKTLAIVAHSSAVREALDFYNLAAYFGDPLVIAAQDLN